VEAISLDMSATKEMNLSPTAFDGIYNLRLFDFHNPNSPDELTRIRLPQGLQFLSNGLRILYWYNYPLKSLPSNFCPEKLVELKMPCSQLEELWNECQVALASFFIKYRTFFKLFITCIYSLPCLALPFFFFFCTAT